MRRTDDRGLRELASLTAMRRLAPAMLPREREPVCQWVESHVSMSYDATSAATGLMRLYPYQREPLAATEAEGVQEVTLEMGQRLGKSTIWKMSLLKRIHDGGLSGLIVYPSLELGIKTNTDTVRPLICSLPEVRRDLAVRGNIKKDSYHVPSMSSVLYFMGGGAQVVSLTANWAVLDECDFVQLTKAEDEDRNMSQIKAVRLRMQTFRNRMLIACSSPSLASGVIHQNWLRGSRGVWNLRCLGCGGLYPVSQLAWRLEDGTYAGLQWSKDGEGRIIEESIRWVCPHCRREHGEHEAVRMNELGEYVHAMPGLVRHRSFRCGALGNPSLWTWLEIAQAQEDATDADGRKYLCNTVLGMPYTHRRETDAAVDTSAALDAKRGPLPASGSVTLVCAGIDQQKNELAGEKYYVWAVRGWDDSGNSWLLESGTDSSLEALRARLSGEWCGARLTLALFDQGGFDNAQDLTPFVDSDPRFYFYKGAGAKETGNAPWVPSRSQPKLFICNAVAWQVRLLSLLYDPPRPKGYRWGLPETPGEEYLRQVAAVQPNMHMTKDGNGLAYPNWCARGDARRDYFDAEKMALAAADLACHYIPAGRFPGGHKPVWWAREKVLEAVRLKKISGNQG